MIQPTPIGGYFEKDERGFIVNPTKWDMVPSFYQNKIQALTKLLIQQNADEVHSIYLRGSLPRGIDPKYISDIDLFMISKKPGMRWKQRKWSRSLISTFKKTNGIDMPIEFYETSYDSNCQENYPQLAAIIKTQSLCIYGDDISQEISSYKPGENMLLHARWLAEDLQKSIANKDDLTGKKQLLKTMIRSGFELVMERENEFTPDLYWCVQSFKKHYPDQGRQMEAALIFYLNFDQYIDEIDPFLNDFGAWLVKETLKTNF